MANNETYLSFLNEKFYICGCAGCLMLPGLFSSWGQRGLGSSLAAASGGCSSLQCESFCCSGFSCCRAVSSLPSGAAERGLRSRGSGWRSGPVFLPHVGSSRTRGPTGVSCPGRSGGDSSPLSHQGSSEDSSKCSLATYISFLKK